MIKRYSFKYLKLIFYLIPFFLSVRSSAQLNDTDQKKLNDYLESASNFIKTEEPAKAANSYYKAGFFCIEKGMNKDAIVYLKESAKIQGDLKDYEKVMKIYSNIGLLYANLDDYDKSLLYFQNSLKIRKNLGDKKEIASGLLDYAYVLAMQDNYKDAILNTLNALEIAQEIQNSKLVLISYRMLAESYQKIGNDEKAGEYLSKFTDYKQYYEKNVVEEKVSGERIKSIAEMNIKDAEARLKQIEYELQMKKKQITEDTLKAAIAMQELQLRLYNDSISQVQKDLVNQKTLTELEQTKIKQQNAQKRLIYIIFGSIIVFIGFVTLMLLLNNRRRRQHNKILSATNKKIAEQNKNIELKNAELSDAFDKIEEQNKDINSSIQYAMGIQIALLPPQENVRQFIPESFILFKPRDKVSGDFYWFKDIEYINSDGRKHKKMFISAIDCTGHGVPGAFLSMMSYNLLDNIVEQKKIYTPGRILDELHNGVRKTLRQKETSNRDGMDMALCSYDPDKNLLEYAGAKNPLIYMKGGKIFRLKGNIKPIGGVIHDKSEESKFINNVIEITEPTTVYIFSDGFADQIGEETGRKLMTKFFRNLLAEIHHKNINEQKDILELFLRKWQGSTDQVDDITVIGFKLYPQNV
jgi:serine phosphatase RsbU (regulator of sigma subunit)